MNNKQLPGPKLTLWIFSLLPFILFWGYFLFYQLKIKKQKLWVALLQTAGVIILFIALLAVFLIWWTVNVGFSLDGVQ